ncbi:MAG: hypothetical protein KJ749_00100 [Planctomycetes bacterium]|nr:hypothetical protein [Planctomycetota bacterium]
MVKSSRSLVARTQRHLRTVRLVGDSAHLDPQDVTELEDRVRTLRALGPRYRRISLSRHVVGDDVIGVGTGVGGECVATEV